MCKLKIEKVTSDLFSQTHEIAMKKKLVVLTLNVKYTICVLLTPKIPSEYQKAATKDDSELKKLNIDTSIIPKIPDLLFTF